MLSQVIVVVIAVVSFVGAFLFIGSEVVRVHRGENTRIGIILAWLRAPI